jgi:hypothetical protein
VKGRIDTEDEIKKAEQYEALKQMLLRLLEDPQVQQKIVTLLVGSAQIHRDRRPRQVRH